MAARRGVGPRAFATGEAQERERLLGAPLRSAPRPSELERPLAELEGVGPKLAELASDAGLETVGDVLGHLPFRHSERGGVRTLAEVEDGEQATLCVEVTSTSLRRARGRKLTIFEARVHDDSGSTKAIWFNQPWLKEKVKPEMQLLLHGKRERGGFRVTAHEALAEAAAPQGTSEDEATGIHTTGLVAVYPAAGALKADRIREWAWKARHLAVHELEPLPGRLRAQRRLPGAADALLAAHFPASLADAEAARDRLAYEELLLYQVALAVRRRRRRAAHPAPALDPPGELVERWLASLPFEPTADQRTAFAELDGDLVAGEPMQRLLMGEVGSGKTVVALYAMLRAFESGYQAALMAPTETLAEQHFATVERLLSAEGLPAALLTGSTPAARRRELLGHLANGQLGLVVGTHALIEPDVAFARLAVAVVDEQHRFGVRQRTALDTKGPGGLTPHTLHMTATPIPRTLSLTAYGDLDATALRELPAGRRPVETRVVGEAERAAAFEYIRERLREGRQCYVVCPLVTESDKLQAKAATEEAERLAGAELAGFDLAVLHGQMPSARKAEAMARFASGEAQVLVATSVIEVGIDVPNATVMVIENADRYGLTQLHQLRGRVGRGEHASICILFAEPGSEGARLRLEAIARERDGFKLAEIDLSLRGEGEVLGTLQHGLPRFRHSVLPEDSGLLMDARAVVLEMLERHGSLDAPELGPLVEAAARRFGDQGIAA